MAILKHEVWLDADGLPTCCLSGPMGDDIRTLLGDDATLVWTFEAASHFEAMTTYHQYLDTESYTTDQRWDVTPYPEEWRTIQRRGHRF